MECSGPLDPVVLLVVDSQARRDAQGRRARRVQGAHCDRRGYAHGRGVCVDQKGAEACAPLSALGLGHNRRRRHCCRRRRLLQGRKLVFFEFSIALKWEGTLLNADGEVTGSGDGSAAITELDQDAGADFPVTVSAAEDGGAADKELAALFRAEAVPELRALVGRFVAELKAQG